MSGRILFTTERSVLAGEGVLQRAVPGADLGDLYRPTPLSADRRQYDKPILLSVPTGWEGSLASEVEVIFAEDDSGSMYGAFGDAKGARRAAALSVITLLVRAGTRRRKAAMAGVIHWGSDAPPGLQLPLTDVRRSRILKRALEIPPTLGGTNVASALDAAASMLRRATGIPVVLLITDGIAALGPDEARALNALPANSVHVLLIDASHSCTPDLEATWQSMPLGSFTRLDHNRTPLLAWQAGEAVARATGQSLLPLDQTKNRSSKGDTP